MSKTKIEWTDRVINPTTGCTKVSEGCQNCYAEKMAKRLQHITPKYKNGFKLTMHSIEPIMSKVLRRRVPTTYFVNSMSDLFHKDIPITYIRNLFGYFHKAPQHRFLILTKRAERMKEVAPQLKFTPNIWLGVTVELAKYYNRIDCLRETPAHIKFLSLEPLLGPLPDLPLKGIDWVIVGGESGQNYREVQIEWIRMIRNQCVRDRMPFFFKQFGGDKGPCGCHNAKGCCLLDGEIWKQYPSI